MPRGHKGKPAERWTREELDQACAFLPEDPFKFQEIAYSASMVRGAHHFAGQSLKVALMAAGRIVVLGGTTRRFKYCKTPIGDRRPSK